MYLFMLITIYLRICTYTVGVREFCRASCCEPLERDFYKLRATKAFFWDPEKILPYASEVPGCRASGLRHWSSVLGGEVLCGESVGFKALALEFKVHNVLRHDKSLPLNQAGGEVPRQLRSRFWFSFARALTTFVATLQTDMSYLQCH